MNLRFAFCLSVLACRTEKQSSDTDSSGSEQADIDSENQPPSATIVFPEAWAELEAGSELVFEATAFDPDHDFSELMGNWSTDNRDLCAARSPDEQGRFSCMASLTEEDALLVFRVVDPEGLQASDNVSVKVVPAPQDPEPDLEYVLTFQVDMGGYLGGVTVGNSIQGWDSAGVIQLVDPDGDGIYVGEMTLAAGTFMEYKFIQGYDGAGVWEDVPLSCGLQTDGYINRYLTMPAEDTLLPLTAFGSCPGASTNNYVCDSAEGRTPTVDVQGYQVRIGQTPLHMKGVNWSPTPLGSGPPWENGFSQYVAEDSALMEAAGINVIRTYGPIEDPAVLDELYSHGIHVLMTVFYGYSDTPESAVEQVCALKDHPAIIGWLIGNEWNYTNLSQNINFDQAVAKVEEVAQAIQNNDATRPVGSIYGGLPNSTVLSLTGSVDFWGVNVYTGASFGNLFSDWQGLSSKPLFLGEYGSDVWDSRIDQENQSMQADIVESLTAEIHANSSVNGSGVCSGGMIFEFNDEWWKYNAGSWWDHDTAESWSNGAYPDSSIQEEWWGLVDIYRNPRAAYDVFLSMTAPTP